MFQKFFRGSARQCHSVKPPLGGRWRRSRRRGAALSPALGGSSPEGVPPIKQILSADKINLVGATSGRPRAFNEHPYTKKGQRFFVSVLFYTLYYAWYNVLHLVGRQHSLPPGGRWHAKRDGRSPRDFGFVLIISQRALPHPTSSGAPSRREPLICASRKSVFFS